MIEFMTIALIRTIILYLLIIFGIKMMGKRQISDLQTSELVITILISNIAAVPMQDSAQPLLSSVIPIISLICYEILVSFLMLKNAKIREIICGKPIVLIKEGKVQQTALKNLRISGEDLFEQLRQADVFSLSPASLPQKRIIKDRHDLIGQLEVLSDRSPRILRNLSAER